MSFEETKEANGFFEKAKNGEMIVDFEEYREINRRLKTAKYNIETINADFTALVAMTDGMLESVKKLNDELQLLNTKCAELFEKHKGEKTNV